MRPMVGRGTWAWTSVNLRLPKWSTGETYTSAGVSVFCQVNAIIEASPLMDTEPATPSPSKMTEGEPPSTGNDCNPVVVPKISATSKLRLSPVHPTILGLRSWVSASFRGVPPPAGMT